jgi:hypothetical protein
MVCLSPPVLPSVICLLSVFIGGIITSSLTISNFSCSSLFIVNAGKTGGDKNIIKRIETTGTTDEKTGGDKPSNEKTETTGTTDDTTGADKHTIKRAYHL